MALSLLLLNSFMLHTLSWVGLLCFLWSALRLAGIKPMTILGNAWARLKASSKHLRSAWLGAGARTNGQAIKAHRAFQLLRIIGPSLCVGAVLGWGSHDIWEFHNTYVLTNAVIDSQNGDYVTYHFEDDPIREPYTLNFSCSRFKPHFKPHQIIAKMTYARKADCESLDGPQYVLKLRRINGVPILEGE